MRVQFSRVEEFLEELQCEGAAPAAMSHGILRLTCTYTPVQGHALRATVIAGVIVHQQLIELQHDCGTVWDAPEKTEAYTAGGKPADVQTNTRVAEVMSTVAQFAKTYGFAVRRGIFAP